MAAEEKSQEQEDQLFMYLVSTFYSSAWMQMGKIENPVTNEVERDLEQAQLSIDILDVLKKKTDGNLTDQEQQYIDRALRELKANFMEEKQKDKHAGKEGKAASDAGSDAPKKSNIVRPGQEDDDEEQSSQQGKSNLWTP